MAHDRKTRDQVRAKYVQGMPLKTAADLARVAYQTARNWKTAAKRDGDDWDIARAAQRMSRSSVDSMTGQVVEEMTVQFLATLEAVKTDTKLAPAAKADILARLSDAFIKVINGAGRSNPKLGAFSICMELLRDLSQFIQTKHPKAHLMFIDILEAFGQEVAKKYSS
jgi:hypothetical protein